jgi:hypothetical protein
MDARAATQAATRLAHCDLGLDLWRYFMHPGKYVAPENLDLEEIKRTCQNGQLVLLAETVLLASRTVKALSGVMEKFLQISAPESLLSLWSSVADLDRLATAKHEAETWQWLWWLGESVEDSGAGNACVRYLDTDNTILQVAVKRNDISLINRLRTRRDYEFLAQMKVPHPDFKVCREQPTVSWPPKPPCSSSSQTPQATVDEIPLTATPADIAKHQGKDDEFVMLLAITADHNNEAVEPTLKVEEDDLYRSIEAFQCYFPELDMSSWLQVCWACGGKTGCNVCKFKGWNVNLSAADLQSLMHTDNVDPPSSSSNATSSTSISDNTNAES